MPLGNISPVANDTPIILSFKVLEESLDLLHAALIRAHGQHSNLIEKLYPVLSPKGQEASLAPGLFEEGNYAVDGPTPSPFVQHLQKVIGIIRAETASLENLRERISHTEQLTEL